MIIPSPVTKRAYLYCDALRRFTIHDYICTAECVLPRTSGPAGEILGGPGWEHVFECKESHAQRRWGVADRNVGAATAEQEVLPC